MPRIDPSRAYTSEELEQEVGSSLRRLRINRNLEPAGLAARAGVSTRALRISSLATGRRSTRWSASYAPLVAKSGSVRLRLFQPSTR